MGNRLFVENRVAEDLEAKGLHVPEAIDVTNKMEYVQFLNTLDHKPAFLGGRNNEWRELPNLRMYLSNVEYKPSQTHGIVMYDMILKRPYNPKSGSRKSSAASSVPNIMHQITDPNDENAQISILIPTKKPPKPSPTVKKVQQTRKLRRLREAYGLGQADGAAHVHVHAHALHDFEIDDDFDNLFDWTTELDAEGLKDNVNDYTLFTEATN
ncbi:uncharacterized protein BJ171DRAFT_585812 [Polychytrium aggregatum]|uniref:uncharacterized protein n=1 Tax=Polychytrium aggregatum TaxID=110093 RepID=UPI0022FEDA98|nr:uncharacterized protein BJ171DRAFT_585812 [Polychytrium aggregatum]KAI9197300.1 hypothetical protein BJ171DRAFT_585812 [Polychytrium aggregatum]